MKHFYLIFLLNCLSLAVVAQEKPTFFGRETVDIKVPTPGLFAKNNKLVWNLDSIADTDYSFPLPGAKVISAYGSHKRRNHSGVDIKTFAKDTIRCAFDGVVRLSKPYGGYGNVVVVRHDNGLETIYSHNHTNFVKVGDELKAGQAIGLTGRTGRATTEHLHFETRVNGQHFNPGLIFDLKECRLLKESLQCIQKGAAVVVKKITN